MRTRRAGRTRRGRRKRRIAEAGATAPILGRWHRPTAGAGMKLTGSPRLMRAAAYLEAGSPTGGPRLLPRVASAGRSTHGRHSWAVFDTSRAGCGRIAAQSETSRKRLLREAGVEPAVRVFPGLRNSPAAERGQARTDEEDLPAQEARTEARTWLPGSHGFKGRSACACPQTREGAQAAHGLTRTRAHTRACLPDASAQGGLRCTRTPWNGPLVPTAGAAIAAHRTVGDKGRVEHPQNARRGRPAQPGTPSLARPDS